MAEDKSLEIKPGLPSEAGKKEELNWIRALHKVSSLFAVGSDINEILEKVLDSIGVRIEAKMIAVWLLDEEGQFYIAASYNIPNEYIHFSRTEKGVIMKNEGLIGVTTKKKRPILMKDIFSHPDTPPEYVKKIRRLKMDFFSLLCSPLIAKGEAIGTLNFYFDRPKETLSEIELKIVKIISDEIAGFVQNSQMYQQVERKTIDLELEKNKVEAIVKSLLDGLVMLDPSHRIVLVNPEAEKILGIKQKEVIHKRLDQIREYSHIDKLYKILEKEEEPIGREYELVFKRPFKQFFQVSITTVTAGRRRVGLMITLHDITREKEIERLKTEFVSIAAHQLRTPLSAIKWTLQMLRDSSASKLSFDEKELLDKGYQSNERMINLINDLLDVARIEEGRLVYRSDYYSLEDIAREAFASMEELAKKKKIKLIFKESKKVLPEIRLDREKILLVMQNLLDNAIRFNNPGGKAEISVDRKKDNKNELEITVKDDGIGIPRARHDRIFKKFFRADNAILHETEGTGLGLFICKNIIEAHGGEIWFESRKGEGTTFCFSLPIERGFLSS